MFILSEISISYTYVLWFLFPCNIFFHPTKEIYGVIQVLYAGLHWLNTFVRLIEPYI